MKIAVVGLSDKPERPSYQVAKYMLESGFEIVPVNPMIKSVLGMESHRSVGEVLNKMKIDVVDIFRKSEEVPAIVREVVESDQRPVIWMQEGVISEEGRLMAETAGMRVVMNACMMKAQKTNQFLAAMSYQIPSKR